MAELTTELLPSDTFIPLKLESDVSLGRAPLTDKQAGAILLNSVNSTFCRLSSLGLKALLAGLDEHSSCELCLRRVTVANEFSLALILLSRRDFMFGRDRYGHEDYDEMSKPDHEYLVPIACFSRNTLDYTVVLSLRNVVLVMIMALMLVPLAGCGGAPGSSAFTDRNLKTDHVDPWPSDRFEEVRIAGEHPKSAFGSSMLFHRTRSTRHRDDASAFPPPYADLVIQPGDDCGQNPPIYVYQGLCSGYTYAPHPIDPSCGSIQWSIDTSGLPAGVTMPFSPQVTPLQGDVYVSVFVPAKTPVGLYSFTIIGMCTNPNATAGNGTGLPYPTSTYTLGIVTTDIVDQTLDPPVIDTTPGTLSDAIGEQEQLFVQVSPTAAQSSMNTLQWQIPSSNSFSPAGAYVNGYSVSDTAASVDSTVDLTANPLKFFAIAAQTGTLQFNAGSNSAGTAFHATAGYDMIAPSVNVNVQNGTFNIGDSLDGRVNVLIAGPTFDSLNRREGIEWTANWRVPSSIPGGQAGMTQLVQADYFTQPSPSPGGPQKNYYDIRTYGQFDADNGAQYGATPPEMSTLAVSSGTSSVVPYAAEDQPYNLLYPCADGSEERLQFQDYFNFTPDSKTTSGGAMFATIPVTIASMTWQADGETSRSDGLAENLGWGDLLIYVPPSSSTVSPSSLLPTWSDNAQNVLGQQSVGCSRGFGIGG